MENLEAQLEKLFTYMMKSDDNGRYYIPNIILNGIDNILLETATEILEMLNNNTISVDTEISDAIKLLKNKEYLISGCGYTIYFNTSKEMNDFEKFVDGIYVEMSKNPEYKDKNLLYRCLSISVANRMKFRVEN